jgi:alpha-L-rhamnosidase
MWERWNGDQMRGDPSMNSYNHYAYGAVADWIYRYAAGIDTLPDDPGFHTIRLHPNFDRRLGSLDFSYQSVYGMIRSAWSISGDLVTWNLTVPPNAKGELPVSTDHIGSFKLDGRPLAKSGRIHFLRQADGNAWYEVPAGKYAFTATLTE